MIGADSNASCIDFSMCVMESHMVDTRLPCDWHVKSDTMPSRLFDKRQLMLRLSATRYIKANHSHELKGICIKLGLHFLSLGHCDAESKNADTWEWYQNVNLLRLSDAYMQQQHKPSLVQIMACCLWRQAIIWTNVHILSIGPSGTNFEVKFQSKFKIFIQGNAFENAVCGMAAILSRPQCVDIRNSQQAIFNSLSIRTHDSPVLLLFSGVNDKFLVVLFTVMGWTWV